MKKSFSDLSLTDIKKHPVWRFTNNDVLDELEIEAIPVDQVGDFSGVIVGAEVVLNDGTHHWALLQNFSPMGKKRNDHFLKLTLYANKECFSLARYHDIDSDTHGPHNLATLLEKQIDQVFPMKFDLREVLLVSSEHYMGSILAAPAKPLTRSQLIKMALENS